MNMGDIFGLAGKMKEMQARMQEVQENLVSIEIDEDLMKTSDREILQDLIVAATNKALEKVEERAKTELQKSTEGMIPNIPGMDLEKMFKQ
jgi:nucleoid-associated protein EbfC